VTVRANLITGEPILFAPDRAARPGAFTGDREPERCPFCPGHEEDTPAPLASIGNPWRVRVVPNKYPPVPGAEVIVEAPDHALPFERIENLDEVLAVTLDRYRAHGDAAYTAIFKNEGRDAGASIPHVHSQLMPVPFVPPRVAREAQAFARTAKCPLCLMIDGHRRDGLVIRETERFAWLAPFASWLPWQQWIVPKDHAPEMSGLDAARVTEVASLLRAASASMRLLSSSFNWGFVNFPGVSAAHWYVDLYPRRTTIAGFELSTGTFVEIVDPAATAQRLRESS
jgi:UDPglucose--hexose-1-phosphate uridylyltransferase